MTVWSQVHAQLQAHPRERLKLWLGRFFYPTSTRQWLAFVHANPVLWQQVARFPKLLTRIYRPYGYRPLGCAGRVDLMVAHYELVKQQGLQTLLARCADEPLPVSQASTKTDTPAQLSLLAVRDGHREGEMSLQLHWGDRVLYALSFLLVKRGAGCDLLVTRLQGNRDDDAKDLIRAATKSFHGYRPSVLLLQAVRQLAFDTGCQSVLLVANRQRVALNPMRRMKIKIDLEGLWRDVGAEVGAHGFFAVSPQVDLPQDFSDVASNKRAEAKRKAALAAQLLQGLSATLAELRTSAPPAQA